MKIVRAADFSSQIIVNYEMNENLYFDIYSETEFRKEIIKDWLKAETYACKDLLKNTAVNDLTIYKQIKVKKINQNSIWDEIQFYLIKLQGKEYQSSRSVLFRVKELSLAWLKFVNA